MEEEKGKYQICGAAAFNFYGLDEPIPSVTYLYNNRISGKRSIGSLAFQFIKVADERLGAVNAVCTREDMEIWRRPGESGIYWNLWSGIRE